MKKILALVLVLAMLLCAFAGCAKKEQAEEAPAEQPAESGEAAASELTVALVVAGTFGDRSFYDSSKAGADALAADYGVQIKTIECNNENHSVQIQNAADNNEIVVLVGWEFYDVETIAPEYPDVHFIWIDNATSAPVENVLNITYAQNEGSFLAGYIGAALSESGVIGVVGGEDSDTINDFIVGYKQGAKYYDDTMTVEVNYTNSYDDPALGKECAMALNDKGADVVFNLASAAGAGIFEAGEERGFYAIGVDSDQKYINDEVIICSMKKEVGNSIYDAIVEYINGDTSKWGTEWIADMSNGYVGIGYGEEGSIQQVPDDVKATVEDLAAQIISGEIVVDTTR